MIGVLQLFFKTISFTIFSLLSVVVRNGQKIRTCMLWGFQFGDVALYLDEVGVRFAYSVHVLSYGPMLRVEPIPRARVHIHPGMLIYDY